MLTQTCERDDGLMRAVNLNFMLPEDFHASDVITEGIRAAPTSSAGLLTSRYAHSVFNVVGQYELF